VLLYKAINEDELYPMWVPLLMLFFSSRGAVLIDCCNFKRVTAGNNAFLVHSPHRDHRMHPSGPAE
jgi:hypothetical protein